MSAGDGQPQRPSTPPRDKAQGEHPRERGFASLRCGQSLPNLLLNELGSVRQPFRTRMKAVTPATPEAIPVTVASPVTVTELHTRVGVLHSGPTCSI